MRITDCNATSFDNPIDAGLKRIDAPVAEQYIMNYIALQQYLSSNDPTAGGRLPIDFRQKMLSIRGYYVGKAQLMCLMKHDFAHFRGLQIQLGLTEHPVDSAYTGDIVFIIQGQYSNKDPKPADLIITKTIIDEGEEREEQLRIDGGFTQMSTVYYMAGTKTIVNQPDPSTYPNPPYAKPPENTPSE